MTRATLYSEEVERALATIARWDRTHARKGRAGIPYLLHPLAVAAFVWDEGGDEEEAIAGLFHDAIEDWDQLDVPRPEIEPMIRTFGERVLAIVNACTDGEPEPGTPKAPWRSRKVEHIDKIRALTDPGIWRVTAADKLSNLRAVFDDLRGTDPARYEAWAHFKGGVFGTEWYYERMTDAVGHLGDGSRLLGNLRDGVTTLRQMLDPLRELLVEDAAQVRVALAGIPEAPDELRNEDDLRLFSLEVARRRRDAPDARVAIEQLVGDWYGEAALPLAAALQP